MSTQPTRVAASGSELRTLHRRVRRLEEALSELGPRPGTAGSGGASPATGPRAPEASPGRAGRRVGWSGLLLVAALLWAGVAGLGRVPETELARVVDHGLSAFADPIGWLP